MIEVNTFTNKDGKFIDSFKFFMSSSLGTLSNNLDEKLFKL